MTSEDLFLKLQSEFRSLRKSEPQIKDYPSWSAETGDITAIVRKLREVYGFEYMDMMTASDLSGTIRPEGYPVSKNPSPYPDQPRQSAVQTPLQPGRNVFRLTYLITSFREKLKVFINTDIPRNLPAAPSLTGLFKTADWQEREIYDMYGINFED